mmetsp:Transcript_18654/g.55755  ORF Transcript_18654/g.55755 Transcript_18654/m.55755 type:complete len:140 (-) Transcript_18654:48-467(-)
MLYPLSCLLHAAVERLLFSLAIRRLPPTGFLMERLGWRPQGGTGWIPSLQNYLAGAIFYADMFFLNGLERAPDPDALPALVPASRRGRAAPLLSRNPSAAADGLPDGTAGLAPARWHRLDPFPAELPRGRHLLRRHVLS